MKSGWLAALLAAAVALPTVSLPAVSMPAARGADNIKTPETTPAKPPSTSDTAPAKPLKGRLPPYYSKIPVDATQKQKIYEIEASYNEKIKALREQLAALEAQQAEEIKAVLTPEQKEKLKELMADAKSKRGTHPSIAPAPAPLNTPSPSPGSGASSGPSSGPPPAPTAK